MSIFTNLTEVHAHWRIREQLRCSLKPSCSEQGQPQQGYVQFCFEHLQGQRDVHTPLGNLCKHVTHLLKTKNSN